MSLEIILQPRQSAQFNVTPSLKIRNSDGKLNGHSVEILDDYGPLLVTPNDNKQYKHGKFNVTHRGTTAIVRSFKTRKQACAAAKEWAVLPVWGFSDDKNIDFVSLRNALMQTPHWAISIGFTI